MHSCKIGLQHFVWKVLCRVGVSPGLRWPNWDQEGQLQLAMFIDVTAPPAQRRSFDSFFGSRRHLLVHQVQSTQVFLLAA